MKMMFVIWAIAVAILIIPRTALAVSFNFTFDQGFEQEKRNEMIYAASRWEAFLHDDVVVNIKVGWGDVEEMCHADILPELCSKPRSVASSDMKPLGVRYTFMRDRLVYDEGQEISRNGLVRWLPKIDKFTADATVPDDKLVIWVTQAQWKALGLTKGHFFPHNSNCDQVGNCWNDLYDATILFNPTFFDGTGSKDREFVSMAVHELGHVLGFISSLDINLSEYYGPSALDMYRFEQDSLNYLFQDQDNDVPTTLTQFRTNERNISRSGIIPWLVMDYDTGTQTFIKEIMSNSYKKQASHWKDLGLGLEIGIMDPSDETYGAHDLLIEQPDLYAMDLIGWDVGFYVPDNNPYNFKFEDLFPDALPWDHVYYTESMDYSESAASDLGEMIDTSRLFFPRVVEAVIDPFCWNFPLLCPPELSFIEKVKLSYLENPKLIMESVVEDMLLDRDSWVGSPPWLPNVGEKIQFIHQDTVMSLPPIANAGENKVISSEIQRSTVLHGTVSDPEGDPLLCRWLNGDTGLLDWVTVGPAGKCPLDLNSVDLGLGTHTLILEVNDGTNIASDAILLSLDNSAPSVGCAGGGVMRFSHQSH